MLRVTQKKTNNIIKLFVINLKNNTFNQIDSVGYQPQFSPDGKKIAYMTTATEIHLINTDGSGHEQLTFNPGTKPNDVKSLMNFQWSNDGQSILFQSTKNSKGGDIMMGSLKIVNVATKVEKTLVAEELVMCSFWAKGIVK